MLLKMQTSRVFKGSKKIPLRFVLVVPFVLQIFAAVGLTGYLSLRNGQKAVNDLATQLHSEVTARIQQQMQTYLATPQLLNQLNADAIRRSQLNIEDLPSERFWQQIQLSDAVSWIYYGAQQEGEFVGITRRGRPNPTGLHSKRFKSKRSPFSRSNSQSYLCSTIHPRDNQPLESLSAVLR
jgi:hypothetical protein